MTDPQERGDLAPGEREMTSADLTAHDPEHGYEPHTDETEAADDAHAPDDADAPDETERA